MSTNASTPLGPPIERADDLLDATEPAESAVETAENADGSGSFEDSKP